jgi:malate dehydrogenase (oxaloacetate-decarboxylating)
MTWAPRIMRTVRCQNEQRSGVLARLLDIVAENGGSIGEVRLISENYQWIERDITVFADNESHMDVILKAIEKNPGTHVLDVRDEVLEIHQNGKISMRSRYVVDSMDVLRRVYTPGVASVCLKIVKEPASARRYTAISNSVAIVTDGTAILGLGDIGPVAGMPVMEGKAMLLDTLVGLSGIPILLDTKDAQKIEDIVAAIAPTFAAIQLEDISAPRCFDIEENLQKRLSIPVMHDDQHGTAVVTLAALISVCFNARVFMNKVTIGQIGLGAAGMATAQMLMQYTGNPVMGTDISDEAMNRFKHLGGIPANLEEIMGKAKIVIGTTGVPGLIKPEMVRSGQIILALSNPYPEIRPEEALANGAAFAVDGRSVNNLLGFPGILRGAIDAQAPYISPEMYVAAAEKIASLTPHGETTPNPLDKVFHRAVAEAVALKAVEQHLACRDFVPSAAQTARQSI